MLDEDNIPKNFELFSFDAPSVNRNSLGTYIINPIGFRDVEFEEYVRVSFKNGNGLKGNKTSGSRCSEKVKWSLNSAMYIDSNHGGNDPFNQFNMTANAALPNSTVTTKPFMGTSFGVLPPNGNIDITKIPSTDELYAILFQGNKFVLAKRKHDDTGWLIVTSSTVSSTGPWEIITPDIEIRMTNSSNPFSNMEEFFFRVHNIVQPNSTPNTVTNKLKVF